MIICKMTFKRLVYRAFGIGMMVKVKKLLNMDEYVMRICMLMHINVNSVYINGVYA